MKVAILAGGMGVRLAPETASRPKPLVEIGSQPVLWHVLKHYDAHGFNEFVIALGYRGEQIKRYVVESCLLSGDLTVGFDARSIQQRTGPGVGWTVHLVETGLGTATGGRLRRLRSYLSDSTFMLTYADVLSDIDLRELLRWHRSHGKLATVTAVQAPSQFGHVTMDGDRVIEFEEKPQSRQGWINGAFFVLEPEVIDYIEGDETVWENDPLERLARQGELMAYRHEGFWQCMDTPRDVGFLQGLWDGGAAPWKTWE